MRDELVDLLKGAGIEEQVDPLSRRQLAGTVLLCETILTPAKLRAALEVLEIFQCVHIEKTG
jgi:hypothetical protein